MANFGHLDAVMANTRGSRPSAATAGFGFGDDESDDTTFISQRRNFIHYVNEQRRGSGFDMANQRMSRSSSARSTLSALSAQSAGSEDSGAPPGMSPKARRKFEKQQEKDRKAELKRLAKEAKAATKKGRNGRASVPVPNMPTITDDRPWRESLASVASAASLDPAEAKYGVKLQRNIAKQKPSINILFLDPEAGELLVRTEKIRGDIIVPLMDIREVRRAPLSHDCKHFKHETSLLRDDEKDLAFAVLFGNEFELTMLCFVASDSREYETWTVGLEQYCSYRKPDFYTSDLVNKRWFKSTWLSLLTGTDTRLQMRGFKMLLRQLDYKAENKQISFLYDRYTADSGNELTFGGFRDLYNYICKTDYLEKQLQSNPLLTGIDPDNITADKLPPFFHSMGMSDYTPTRCRDIAQRYQGLNGQFSLANLVEFLHGNENAALNPAIEEMHQDMTQPLSHYFVASSHNTYLFGDQFRSESSIEAYITCLRMGCRCLEIDCWNGAKSDIDPEVTHGYTMCSKIKFSDVVKAIAEHAFWASSYPIILSLENHADVPRQQFMAEVFQSCFGDRLITSPIPEWTPKTYPSPDAMKGRVILKHKKLRQGASDVEVSNKDKSEDLSASLMNGYLNMKDEVDGRWESHYFVLTHEWLFYSEPHDEDEELDDDDAEDTQFGELHESELWFHDKMKEGAAGAKAVIRDFVIKLSRNTRSSMQNDRDPTGVFLVRAGSQSPYVLAVWINATQKVEQMKIHRNADGCYWMVPAIKFRSLFELVEYHKRAPLKGKEGSPNNFEIFLTTPVPRPAEYETQPWYKSKLRRDEAEDLLNRVRIDGVFLVRVSDNMEGEAEQKFAITFCAEQKIKHCEVFKEGGVFRTGEQEYNTLTGLIDFYKKNSLYRKQRLRYPVTDELIAEHGVAIDTSEELYMSQELYARPNDMVRQNLALTVTCKALYNYTAKSADELTFSKDTTILNVYKSDGDWWRGSCNDQKGKRFPCNYVEEVNMEELAKKDRTDGDNILGDLEQGRLLATDLVFVTASPKPDDPQGFHYAKFTKGADTILVATKEATVIQQWKEKVEELKNKKQNDAKSAKSPKKKAAAKIKVHKMKIHKQLSDMIHFCQSIPWKSFELNEREPFMCLSSFNEKKAIAINSEGSTAQRFNHYAKTCMARVYPAGVRVDSSNFDPYPMWNCGFQLVALNYQTPDKYMWINNGKFHVNGKCGIVLKPPALLQPDFNPFSADTYSQYTEACTMSVRIISGRHLSMTRSKGKGIVSPLVKLEIIGVNTDTHVYKTREQRSLGLCPTWNEAAEFTVTCPEAAMLCITAYNVDSFQENSPIGQRVFPVGSKAMPGLRSGFRSVPLYNVYGHPIANASILLHIKTEFKPIDLIKQQLKEKIKNLQMQQAQIQMKLMKERKTAGRASMNSESQQKLFQINEQLSELLKHPI